MFSGFELKYILGIKILQRLLQDILRIAAQPWNVLGFTHASADIFCVTDSNFHTMLVMKNYPEDQST